MRDETMLLKLKWATARTDLISSKLARLPRVDLSTLNTAIQNAEDRQITQGERGQSTAHHAIAALRVDALEVASTSAGNKSPAARRGRPIALA